MFISRLFFRFPLNDKNKSNGEGKKIVIDRLYNRLDNKRVAWLIMDIFDLTLIRTGDCFILLEIYLEQ